MNGSTQRWPWSEEEHSRLLQARRSGANWSQVARQVRRTVHACRKRYTSHLQKTGITPMIAHACGRCQRRKIRCYGSTPSCTPCSSSGVECRASNKLSRQSITRSYTKSLESRVRDLEAQTRELRQALDGTNKAIHTLSQLHNSSSASQQILSSLLSDAKVELEADRSCVPADGSLSSSVVEGVSQEILGFERYAAPNFGTSTH